MKLLLITVVLFFSSFTYQDQKPGYFEGKIVYALKDDRSNDLLKPAQKLSKIANYYKDTMYKSSILEGRAVLSNLGELIANTSDTTRFNVNSFYRTATSLGMEPIVEAYIPKDVTYLHDQDSVLGHPCKKYKMTQRTYLDGTEKTSYVWVAEDLRVRNLPLLGRIFGFRNTLIETGELGGIILRIETLSANGSVESITEAVDVVPMRLGKSFFEIPPNYIYK